MGSLEITVHREGFLLRRISKVEHPFVLFPFLVSNHLKFLSFASALSLQALSRSEPN